ncbi:replication-associated recombination protein A [Patescibacteria group bacterium]
METIFSENLDKAKPLADRLRPQNLDEYFGQQHILGKDQILRSAIENENLHTMIFWGPPGCGKTTLASVIANITKSKFVMMSAVAAGKKELFEQVDRAKQELELHQKKTILFVDEIHRWNKAQQDALLPYVEQGVLTLIGATTENPSFEIISPLLSRLRVYVLKPLEIPDLKKVIKRALDDKERGLGKFKAILKPEAEKFLIYSSGGDARTVLNALESAVQNKSIKNKKIEITKNDIEQALQHRALKYDKDGEEHYNLISAFIKSLRGSNVDGALYWLVRMLEAGEDPKFIARRMVVLASEDIGNAHSMALVVANAVFDAVHKIGMPECRINLAQGVVYLARAPKSNKSYIALCNAEKDVKESGALPVPLHLRNAPTNLMKDLGYGKGYKYTHTDDDSKQEYLPEELKNKKYYK